MNIHFHIVHYNVTCIYIEMVNRIVFSVHFLNKFVSLLKLLPILMCATKGGLYVPALLNV